MPENSQERSDPELVNDYSPMLGSSIPMQDLKSRMAQVAASSCTVLITGETGTGKELAAEFMHRSSPRRNKPFVCINCAAIPEGLLESELFGHAAGAFTGAAHSHEGLFAAANGGTIFLDEIGDMSMVAQAKILRVLEQKEICRLGGTNRKKLDVRFMAATNHDLHQMSNHGAFRKDLFFRLNVVRIQMPPLRDRKDDIPILVDYYRRKFAVETNSSQPELSEECLKALLQYDWPGNIRELRNALESMIVASAPSVLCTEDLPEPIRRLAYEADAKPRSERDQLISALVSAKWNKSRAAAKLRWSRMTLYRKMAKYRISATGSESAPSSSEPSASVK